MNVKNTTSQLHDNKTYFRAGQPGKLQVERAARKMGKCLRQLPCQP